MFIEFDESLRVGHEQIDSEHRILASRINLFLEKLAAGEDRERLDGAYQNIIDYASEHFAHEERLMFESGYHDRLIHISRHGKLLAELQERSRYILGGDGDDLVDVMSFIHDWFRFHIKTCDAKLADFLRGRAP